MLFYHRAHSASIKSTLTVLESRLPKIFNIASYAETSLTPHKDS